MPLTLATPPGVHPVTLEMAKAYLKVDGTEEDALIEALLGAATSRVEYECDLALITQQWRLHRDRWPGCGVLEIPLHPVRAVEEIRILTADGLVTVDPALYETDLAGRPARVRALAGFPRETEGLNVVEVLIRAGFGDAPEDVPADLRQAILLVVAHWFENREGVDGSGGPGLPAEALRLMASWRRVRL